MRSRFIISPAFSIGILLCSTLALSAGRRPAHAGDATPAEPLLGVAVEIQDGRDPTRNGATLRYRVTFRNTSDRAVSGLMAKVSYDQRLTFRSATPPPDSGTTDRWTVGRLEPGQRKAMIIRTRVALDTPAAALLRTEISLGLAGGESIADYEISSVRVRARRRD